MRIVRRAVTLVLAVVLFYALFSVGQVVMYSTKDEARRADAILVLGAAQYEGVPSPVLERRLDHALALRERGIAKTIIVTGGGAPGDKYTEARASANYLHDHGVPDKDILREVRGRDTWQSLADAEVILHDHDIREVVLVTDGYHTARAKAMAEDLGIQALVSPVPTTAVKLNDAGRVLRESAIYGAGRIIGFPKLLGIKRNLSERAGPGAGG